MTRGGSLEFHHCRILCRSFSLDLGCQIWCSFCSHFGSWNTVKSSLWTGVCPSLGISPSTTTSFHPQSNGMIEWFHRSLKTALCARLAGLDWFLHLPLVLLGLQFAPKEDTGFFVSEAVFGSPLNALQVPSED